MAPPPLLPQVPTWSGTVTFQASRQGQPRRVDIHKRGILVRVEQVGGVGFWCGWEAGRRSVLLLLCRSCCCCRLRCGCCCYCAVAAAALLSAQPASWEARHVASNMRHALGSPESCLRPILHRPTCPVACPAAVDQLELENWWRPVRHLVSRLPMLAAVR